METLIGLNLSDLIRTIGYIGIFGIIFAESGVLVGFFLPGDSLLFTAGLLAAGGYLSLPLLLVTTAIGAIIGDSTGYALGRRFGPSIFSKEKSFFFQKGHITRAREFYKKYGGKALILARFLPIIRTLAPILAGVGEMGYGKFLSYNVVGGLLWTTGLLSLGFVLGNTVPSIDTYLLPIIILIVLISVLPPTISILKDKENRRELWQAFRSYFK